MNSASRTDLGRNEMYTPAINGMTQSIIQNALGSNHAVYNIDGGSSSDLFTVTNGNITPLNDLPIRTTYYTSTSNLSYTGSAANTNSTIGLLRDVNDSLTSQIATTNQSITTLQNNTDTKFDNYYTKSETLNTTEINNVVDTKINNIDTKFSNYYTKSETQDTAGINNIVDTKITENNKNYYTREYVDNLVFYASSNPFDPEEIISTDVVYNKKYDLATWDTTSTLFELVVNYMDDAENYFMNGNGVVVWQFYIEMSKYYEYANYYLITNPDSYDITAKTYTGGTKRELLWNSEQTALGCVYSELTPNVSNNNRTVLLYVKYDGEHIPNAEPTTQYARCLVYTTNMSKYLNDYISVNLDHFYLKRTIATEEISYDPATLGTLADRTFYYDSTDSTNNNFKLPILEQQLEPIPYTVSDTWTFRVYCFVNCTNRSKEGSRNAGLYVKVSDYTNAKIHYRLVMEDSAGNELFNEPITTMTINVLDRDYVEGEGGYFIFYIGASIEYTITESGVYRFYLITDPTNTTTFTYNPLTFYISNRDSPYVDYVKRTTEHYDWVDYEAEVANINYTMLDTPLTSREFYYDASDSTLLKDKIELMNYENTLGNGGDYDKWSFSISCNVNTTFTRDDGTVEGSNNRNFMVNETHYKNLNYYLVLEDNNNTELEKVELSYKKDFYSATLSVLMFTLSGEITKRNIDKEYEGVYKLYLVVENMTTNNVLKFYVPYTKKVAVVKLNRVIIEKRRRVIETE